MSPFGCQYDMPLSSILKYLYVARLRAESLSTHLPLGRFGEGKFRRTRVRRVLTWRVLLLQLYIFHWKLSRFFEVPLESL